VLRTQSLMVVAVHPDGPPARAIAAIRVPGTRSTV
jgi:hypothetical protein